MNCPNCNATLTDGAHFCPECGTRIDADQATASHVQAQPAAQVAQIRSRVDGFVQSGAIAANMPWIFIGVDVVLLVMLILMPWIGYGGFFSMSLPSIVLACFDKSSMLGSLGVDASQIAILGIVLAAVLVVNVGLAGLRLYEAFSGKVVDVPAPIAGLASHGYLVSLISIAAVIALWFALFIANAGGNAASYAFATIQLGAWLSLLASGVGFYLKKTAK